MRENRYITDFYNHYDEDGRLALRHGSVEFLTTMRYIEKYLRPGCRVLEVGAGTDVYKRQHWRCHHLQLWLWALPSALPGRPV